MDLDRARYVSLTTRRRSGDRIASPVWIAPLGDGRYGFTTGTNSGKVKRIRNFPDVELQPCDVRGRVLPGSTVYLATARVVEGTACEPVRRAIRKKYGFQFLMISLMGSIRSRLGGERAADCAVVLQPQ